MKNLSKLKVLVVGLGQIGGSIAMDLVELGLATEVTGYDADPSTTDRALMNNIINRKADSLKEEVRRSDLVILAAPIREIIKMIPIVCRAISDASAILDMAGTKADIFAVVAECGRTINYFGGHPLAGNEKQGLSAAERRKFEGNTFVVTPFDNSVDEEWLHTILQLIAKLGASPLIMSAEDHDRMIALTSHLPYAVALVLKEMIAGVLESDDRVKSLIGGSFRSATRVAASSPDLTLDMFLTNRDNIAAIVDDMISHLARLKEMIQSGNEAEMSKYIENSREGRQDIT